MIINICPLVMDWGYTPMYNFKNPRKIVGGEYVSHGRALWQSPPSFEYCWSSAFEEDRCVGIIEAFMGAIKNIETPMIRIFETELTSDYIVSIDIDFNGNKIFIITMDKNMDMTEKNITCVFSQEADGVFGDGYTYTSCKQLKIVDTKHIKMEWKEIIKSDYKKYLSFINTKRQGILDN